MAYYRKSQKTSVQSGRKFKKSGTYSKKPYKRNRVAAIAKPMKTLIQSVEHKIQGTRQHDITPTQIQNGARCYAIHTVNTVNNAGSNPTFEGIDSLSFPKGDNRNNRTGEKMYLKDTYLLATLRMNENYQSGSLTAAEFIDLANFQNTEFRAIAFQIKANGRTTGAIPNAGQQLFLAPDGSEVGEYVNGIRGDDLMIMPVNKKRFQVYMDKRFTLNPPVQVVTGSSGGGGQVFMLGRKSFMDLRCKVGHNRIVHFGQASGTSNEPSSGNNNVYFVVYATSSVRTAFQDNWKIDVSYSTTALDN